MENERWIVLLPALLSAGVCSAGPPAPRFRVEYRPPERNADLMPYHLAFSQSRTVDGLLDEVARRVALPRDIPVVFMECGQPNAFYSPDHKAIIACYELPELIGALLARAGVPEDRSGRLLGGAFVHALFHEIGHGLIDMYDLPVTGREEDAADRFSTFLLLRVGRVGAEALVSAAVFFLTVHDLEAQGGTLPFWDEHGLGAQRFYNLLCRLYGSDPRAHADLVEAGYLPQDRAVRCPRETEQLVRSWARLLGGRIR
jgi:hypothetical protein